MFKNLNQLFTDVMVNDWYNIISIWNMKQHEYMKTVVILLKFYSVLTNCTHSPETSHYQDFM